MDKNALKNRRCMHVKDRKETFQIRQWIGKCVILILY